MECSRIPAADDWDQFSAEQQESFQHHLEYCSSCRARIFTGAPEKLLFELQGPAMPEEFWIGFWDSLYLKLSSRPAKNYLLPMLRWTAVFAVGVMIVLYSHTLPRPLLRAQTHRSLPDSYRYPLVEEVRNPKATYYIFQPSGDEKIVIIVDPDLEL